MKFAHAILIIGFSAVAVLPLPAIAADYSWSNSSVDTDWSTAANWSPEASPSGPASGDTALLGSSESDRFVIYDSGAGGSLATLSFAQNAAFTNSLEVRRSLSLSDGLALSASSGSATVFLNTSATAGDGFAALTSGTVLTDGSVTVGSGGILEFGRQVTNSTSALTYLSGSLTIDGGTFRVQNAAQTTSGANLFIYRVNDLALDSGTFELGAATTNTGAGFSSIFDTRLQISGNFTANGGTINDLTTNASSFVLGGAVNSISSAVTILNPDNLAIVLQSDSAQALTSGKSIHRLTIRGTGDKTLAMTDGASFTDLTFWTTDNKSVTTILSGDIHVTGSLKRSAGTNTGIILDTAGHTLDNSGGTMDLSNATWTFQGDGTVKASSFNLAAATATNIDGTTLLLAVAPGSTDDLGGAGTISADSTFIYDAAGAASTLQSNRAIGHLRIDHGTLKLAGANDIGASSVTVGAGAILDASSRSFFTTGNAITLDFTGTEFGSILTSGLFDAKDITLTLDFGATSAVGGAYALFGNSTTLVNAFDSVDLGGLYEGASLNEDNDWTTVAGGFVFTFDTLDGSLNVSNIPEPSPMALCVVALLPMAMWRMRRIG